MKLTQEHILKLIEANEHNPQFIDLMEVNCKATIEFIYQYVKLADFSNPSNFLQKVITSCEQFIGEILTDEEFKKFDKDKLQYTLLPRDELQEIVKVLQYGANKYGANNWKKCDDTDRYVNALFRHLEDYRGGELLDSESKLSHLAHIACNAIFLMYFERSKK